MRSLRFGAAITAENSVLGYDIQQDNNTLGHSGKS